MPAPHDIFRISPPSDMAVARLFGDLVQQAQNSNFVVEVTSVHIGTFTDFKGFAEKYPEIDWENTRNISRIAMNIQGGPSRIEFRRAVTEPSGAVASRWENEIFLEHGPQRLQPDVLLPLLNIMTAFVERQNSSTALQVDGFDQFKSVIAGQIAQLSELNTKIVHDSEEARRAHEIDFEDRRKELERQFDERRQQLDTETESRREQLGREFQSLEEQKKELDDRGHMHARRQLRSQITDSIRDRLRRPGVSSGATNLRLMISAGSIAGIVGFGYYAYFSAADVSALLGHPSADRILVAVALGRFAIAAGGAAGLLFYLLGWLRQIHNDDVHSERDLERYRYDIDRASWAIETILEAQEKEAGDVPALWIEGVTRNLFDRAERRTDDGQPLEALGALLNVAAKAEIGPGGTKLEFEKRGLRQMGKAATAEAQRD